jgi:hypothetical protein
LALPLTTGNRITTAQYQMTAPTPGPRALRLSVYNGGFYIATVPIQATFAEAPPKGD